MRRLIPLIFIVTACIFVQLMLPAVGFFQDSPANASQSGVLPDWTQASFSSLGATDSDAEISYGSFYRAWNAGDTVSDVLTLEDISPQFASEQLTLGDINTATGQDWLQQSVGSFDLLAQQRVDELVDVVPNLGDFRVVDVLPLESLFSNSSADLSDATVAEALDQDPLLNSLRLDSLGDELETFSVGEIPNVEMTRLDSLNGWESATVSEVPGLSNVPFMAMPNFFDGALGIIARIDMVWGKTEDHRQNTVSGSNQSGFKVPCSEGGKLVEPEVGDKCAYIELDDLEDEGRPMQGSFEGKQWISGRYHEVQGGFGSLKNMPSPLGYMPGYEPTGRHPFGDLFKVVVWEPDETSDRTSFRMFFRWCTYYPGEGRTCTPYNQMAAPFFTQPVNSYVYIGPLDGQGGASAAPSRAKVAAAFNVSSRNGAGRPSFGSCSKEVIAGISIDNLKEGIASIESRGTGDYTAIGIHTCDRYGLCGRALGRYQMMSYLPEVEAEVWQVQGGRDWLDRINDGYEPSVAEINTYFPKDAQERAFDVEIHQLFETAQRKVDPQTGQLFEGDRLVERVTQTWFSGENGKVDDKGSDDLGRLSVYEYGVESRKYYNSIGGAEPACTAGATTGDFIFPATEQWSISSGYGPREIGCQRSKFHPAIDIAMPIGESVLAADGGTVQYAGEAGGYGYTVVIDHGGGTKTRYSHLSEILVGEGQGVNQGDAIALSGNSDGNSDISTGPHLDFGIYLNDPYDDYLPASGNAVNPIDYLDF
ncbi:MAG: M23 family metallopeptidase [Cyanobacteria bacterium J06649_5]